MIELKHQFMLNKDMSWVPCYLKSEADKVIAELNAQKAQAEDDCAYWKNKYKDCKRELDLLKDTNAFYNGEKK